MSSKEEEITQFLRYVGIDIVSDGVVAPPECEGNEIPDEDGYGLCPDHYDCGICRFEYMKQKGWLDLTEG